MAESNPNEDLTHEALAHDFEILRLGLIYKIEGLHLDLEHAYANEFIRLTDHEEDAKWSAIPRLQRILNTIDEFFAEKNIDPTGNRSKLPTWLMNLQFVVSSGRNRTCFEIIAQILPVLLAPGNQTA